MRAAVAPSLEALLASIDMSLDEAVCPGLVAVSALPRKKRDPGTPLEEILALERAEHFGAHYVYFRRTLGRGPSAVAYIYDWTDRLHDAHRSGSKRGKAAPQALRKELANLHRGVWSACEIPLVYVFLPTNVEIYHILKGPRAEGNTIAPDPWRSITLAGDLAQALEAFSARKLDDGTFWDDQTGSDLKLEGAAFMALSEEIEECRAELKKQGVQDLVAKRLLILFVMIKYLEERRDRHGRGVFPEGLFARFASDALDFVGLLRAGGGAVLAFLDHLASKERFNGDVFQLEGAERMAIAGADLQPFADLLDARIQKGQRTFWRRYAFSELPVELISHLYEQFLPKQPGVVYTPPFLVSFILDEVLPLSESTPESFRLIDFACGSGVFLVGAYKRLVQRWRRDHDFQYPNVDTLKSLLEKHVFGVDIEPEAVRLTMFSLCVALCDSLESRVVWDNLHFDRLHGRNLFEGDYFTRESQWRGEAGFDLVVGNPPFRSETSDAATEVMSRITEKEPDFDLPDKQVALLFLKSATRIAKQGARIALMQPSGPLLYNEGSSRFRQHFLRQVHVSQIVDLTHLSRVLFKRPRKRGLEAGEGGSNNPADFPVAIVFAEKRDPDDEEPLLHVTVRRTAQAEQRLMLEIDHYDLHFIPRQEAIEDPRIWKANFIGGGRIPQMLRRLGDLRTLGAFLDDAVSRRGWDQGEGFTVGDEKKVALRESLAAREGDGALTEAEKELKKRYRLGPWLTDKRVLPTAALTAEGINLDAATLITQRFFAEPRRETLFKGPLLLVKAVDEAAAQKVPLALIQEDICFLHQIYGIHAPKADLPLLERVRDALSDDRRLRFHLLATSGGYLIGRSSAFRTGDMLTLPFPESPQDLKLSPLEQALFEDALDHVADFKRNGNEAKCQKPPNDDELRQFGDFFCLILGSVYKELKADAPVRLPNGVCFPFYFGAAPSVRLDSGRAGAMKLDKLLNASVGSSLRCQRILRVFQDNMLFLVKPARLRYWLRSIAVRDADELFVDLQAMGY